MEAASFQSALAHPSVPLRRPLCGSSSPPGLAASRLQARSASGSLSTLRQSKLVAIRCHVSQNATQEKILGSGTPVGAVSGAVMTDESVPEGHKGLHGFLYGDSGADVHDAQADDYQLREGEDDGVVLIALADFEASRARHKLAGVYAVYDAQQALQFVGYSRNILLSLKGHKSNPGTAPLTCAVRVKVFRDPAMVTRSRLDAERTRWMQELCEAGGLAATVAPGNTEECLSLWEGRAGPSASAMSEAELLEYEEKKLKMRKAMGENLHDDVEGESMDSRQRRLALLQAVEGDDWSAVIHQQTQQTTNGQMQPALTGDSARSVPASVDDALGKDSTRTGLASANGALAGSPDRPVVSPFASSAANGVPAASPRVPGPTVVSPFASAAAADPVQETAGEGLALEMTRESVHDVLDAVRPYLIADGGNVEVVAVDAERGVVDLMLQGACGTCPSSTTTMKMGIERVLREKFGERLAEVRQVGSAASPPTVALVDAHLDMLRPAIHNFKGSVEVLRVDEKAGLCEVKYVGPAPVGMGIQAAIKDKFPTLHTVTLVAP